MILSMKKQAQSFAGNTNISLIKFGEDVTEHIGAIKIATHTGFQSVAVSRESLSDLFIGLQDGIGSIVLVEPNSLNASSVRISTAYGVKALALSKE